MTLSKPYSSESKFRCRRFDTFWRFLAFVLAKLPLKAELEYGVTFYFLLSLELQKVGMSWSAIYVTWHFEWKKPRVKQKWALPRLWQGVKNLFYYSILQCHQQIHKKCPTSNKKSNLLCLSHIKNQLDPGLIKGEIQEAQQLQ